MTDIIISDDILKKATDCEKNFSCLSPETRDVCVVRPSTIRGDMAYIEDLDGKPCPYRHTFGTSGIYICECPVRMELCRKYGI